MRSSSTGVRRLYILPRITLLVIIIQFSLVLVFCLKIIINSKIFHHFSLKILKNSMKIRFERISAFIFIENKSGKLPEKRRKQE